MSNRFYVYKNVVKRMNVRVYGRILKIKTTMIADVSDRYVTVKHNLPGKQKQNVLYLCSAFTAWT